ncbi:hypothetical protein [Nonomuraea sp. SYSU D8015]|uniref:hypothetical protein n=1 Tax=Nonomuraea sp. SYSU D8015 TaxID=2593644 RepID=UPI001660F844|nr:hypothetical protein [Nonomuraea sp. SYSU D8015]
MKAPRTLPRTRRSGAGRRSAGITSSIEEHHCDHVEQNPRAPSHPSVPARGRVGGDSIRVDTPLKGHVFGGNGADAYFAGTAAGPTEISYNGGNGSDYVVYSESTQPVRVSLDDSEPGGGPDGRLAFGDRDDIRSDVENITGSDFDDNLAGSEVANLIEGGLGKDQMFGFGGADTLRAKEGAKDGVIACGTGTDAAIVDSVDPTTLSCENVTK